MGANPIKEIFVLKKTKLQISLKFLDSAKESFIIMIMKDSLDSA